MTNLTTPAPARAVGLPQAGNAARPAPRRIAVIGGGIAGLTAAYDLLRSSDGPVEVTIYEGGAHLGGLAAGFRGRSSWAWPLEHFYHHLFTNDDAIIGLTRELGMAGLLETHRPTTVMHIQGENYPFDTPLRLLKFPKLGIIDKVRMGVVIAFLKYLPFAPWKRYDRILADKWLEKWMGKRGYDMVWRPMLQGKFGPYYQEVNLAWFWARIYKRTPKLAYYRGGFQSFVEGLAQKVRALGGRIVLGAQVDSIRPAPDSTQGGLLVEAAGAAPVVYDTVIATTSPGLLQRIAPDLPADYLGRLENLTSIGAVVLTVALDRQLLTDGAYWVNLPKREGLPFLALVEHTNMIDPAHYGGDHLLYLGDYLPADHPYFALDTQALLEEFVPALTRMNPNFERSWVTGAWKHSARYAQPVPPVGYAAQIPPVRTPLPGLYFASMSQVYPWDRGTNYAVEMGRKVAALVQKDAKEPLATDD
jgi:protoporphyrinogen oxidase